MIQSVEYKQASKRHGNAFADKSTNIYKVS